MKRILMGAVAERGGERGLAGQPALARLFRGARRRLSHRFSALRAPSEDRSFDRSGRGSNRPGRGGVRGAASNNGAVRRQRLAPDSGEAEAPVNGAGEHQSLSKYIQTRFDECSRSQKDVAQYIVDHLDEAAFQTAEELARRANTSSSTVVRFSQALGFEGFPELQAAAREEYRRVHAQRRRQRRARRRQLDAAVLARPERVRDGAGGGPPERRGDRAQGLARRGR